MQRKHRDIKEFGKVNLPQIVAEIDPSYAKFSGIRVLDMPVYMRGQGWQIPKELDQFRQILREVTIEEFQYDIQDYVYITVDQKVVQPGKTGRRAGAHSDAYIETAGAQIDLTHTSKDAINEQAGEVSHTYIVYDCRPTEFFDVPFPLTDASDAASLQTFDSIANAAKPVVYASHSLLKLDPYVVHRCAVNEDIAMQRTFVKVSVSNSKYARIGNTINPAFKYDWELKARSPHERNTPW